MRPIFTQRRLPLLVTYLCLAAIAGAMFVLARGFPAAHMGAAAPGFFPQVISALLLLLSLLGLWELSRSAPEKVVFPPAALAAMALALGYIGMMELVGYYPSTLLFSLAIMALVRGGASWLRLAIDSVLITLVSYLFFELAIDAYLPTGILFQ